MVSVRMPGVCPTATPARVAAARSILSTPTARLLIARSRGRARIIAASKRSVTMLSTPSACRARVLSSAAAGGISSSHKSTRAIAASRRSAGSAIGRVTNTRRSPPSCLRCLIRSLRSFIRLPRLAHRHRILAVAPARFKSPNAFAIGHLWTPPSTASSPRFPRFVAAHPEVREMDLNPVVAYASGVRVLDAILLAPPGGNRRSAPRTASRKPAPRLRRACGRGHRR